MSEEIKAAGNAIMAAGLLGGIIGALLATLFNHRLTLWREKRSGITAEKVKIAPLIDGYIIGANKGEMLGTIRFDAQEKLLHPALAFRVRLKGRSLRRFNTAWEAFYNTTREEVGNAQPNTTAEQNESAKRILTSRLANLRRAIEQS